MGTWNTKGKTFTLLNLLNKRALSLNFWLVVKPMHYRPFLISHNRIISWIVESNNLYHYLKKSYLPYLQEPRYQIHFLSKFVGFQMRFFLVTIEYVLKILLHFTFSNFHIQAEWSKKTGDISEFSKMKLSRFYKQHSQFSYYFSQQLEIIHQLQANTY